MAAKYSRVQSGTDLTDMDSWQHCFRCNIFKTVTIQDILVRLGFAALVYCAIGVVMKFLVESVGPETEVEVERGRRRQRDASNT